MINVIKNTKTEIQKAKMGEKLTKDETRNIGECAIELSFQAQQIISQLSTIAYEDLSKAEKNILCIVMDKNIGELKESWKE